MVHQGAGLTVKPFSSDCYEAESDGGVLGGEEVLKIEREPRRWYRSADSSWRSADKQEFSASVIFGERTSASHPLRRAHRILSTGGIDNRLPWVFFIILKHL